MKILITGGAGFIGSTLVRQAIGAGHEVVNVDALTYAASLSSVEAVSKHPGYAFVKADVADPVAMQDVFDQHSPDAVLHLAAESHVDRSIDGPDAFMRTNVMGTFTLLQAARAYWEKSGRRSGFRFHHVSTDEVFGSLGPDGKFKETTPYAPNSPYAASKAASDHLVRAWGETYDLPVVISNCSNNYGPFQFPEKLIPVVMLNALAGQAIPVYGDGSNVRDWLFVEDHADALLTILQRGEVGRSYNVGGNSEVANVGLVRLVCNILDDLKPGPQPYAQHITFVEDRPGHDARYAIDASRLEAELGWTPSVDLETGLRRTVAWYLDNEDWWRPLLQRDGAGKRLGLLE